MTAAERRARALYARLGTYDAAAVEALNQRDYAAWRAVYDLAARDLTEPTHVRKNLTGRVRPLKWED